MYIYIYIQNIENIENIENNSYAEHPQSPPDCANPSRQYINRELRIVKRKLRATSNITKLTKILIILKSIILYS